VGYKDWFAATFPYPDDGILGAADFPSSPWSTVSGKLISKAGRAVAVGDGVAVASHGYELDYDALRLRFQFTLAEGAQAVGVAFNADEQGDGGFAITVSSETGEVSVEQDGESLSADSFGALETGIGYFVEAVFDGGQVTVALSENNYLGVPGAVVAGMLSSPAPGAPGSGGHVRIHVGDGSGVGGIHVAKCGVGAPKYEALFRDTFDRGYSATPGNAELPPVAWQGDTADVEIADNALTFAQQIALKADQGTHYSTRGLRLRTSVRFAPYGWLYFGYNGDTGGSGGGFDFWREADDKAFLEYSGAAGSERFPLTLDTSQFYFLQYDVDGESAVFTLRVDSYTGQIVAAAYVDAIKAAPAAYKTLSLGHAALVDELALTIDEAFVDQYGDR
jgi:hypothetical protein